MTPNTPLPVEVEVITQEQAAKALYNCLSAFKIVGQVLPKEASPLVHLCAMFGYYRVKAIPVINLEPHVIDTWRNWVSPGDGNSVEAGGDL